MSTNNPKGNFPPEENKDESPRGNVNDDVEKQLQSRRDQNADQFHLATAINSSVARAQEGPNPPKSLQQQIVHPQEVIVKPNDAKQISWIFDIGKPAPKTFVYEERSSIPLPEKEDRDVYPLSVRYSNTQKTWMKTIRTLTFIACLVVALIFFPYDFFLRSQPRVYYSSTDYARQTVYFNPDQQDSYVLNIANCKVYLYNKVGAENSFDLEYEFPKGTVSIFNNTLLFIQAPATESCIVNMYLPSLVDLPHFEFLFQGTQENIIFDDKNLGGTSLNFKSGISISGQKCFVFLRNHNIENFEANFERATISLSNIQSITKNVYIESGLYNEILSKDQKVVVVNVTQPDAHICLYGPTILQDETKQCRPINQNVTDTQCQIDAILCLTKSDCISQPASTISLTVNDGPIQIRYEEMNASESYQSVYLRTNNRINYTGDSLYFLNQSLANFIEDQVNDRIQTLQTIGMDYEQTWLYTNKRVYLQAQYWPFVWGSASLLQPKLTSTKMILIDYVCPARQKSIKIDTEINQYYQMYYPLTAMSQVAKVDSFSNFSSVTENGLGNFQYSQILLSQSPTLIASFVIAAVISVIGSLFFFDLFYVFGKAVKTQYLKYIESRRQLIITQLQAQSDVSTMDIEIRKKDFEAQSKIYEERGIFWSSFRYGPKYIESQKLQFKFSIFFIPQLVGNYLYTQKLNSLRECILKIEENGVKFPEEKFNQIDKSEVQIPLQEFIQYYSNFCSENGMVEMTDIEKDGQDTLHHYGLSIEQTSEAKLLVYAHLRFKTLREKEASDKLSVSSTPESSVNRFLTSECVYSKFESDFIAFDDLQNAYIYFCNEQGIPESQRDKLTGNDYFEKLNISVKEKSPPKYILGVKKIVREEESLIRRVPNHSKVMMFFNRAISLLGSKISSIDGVIPNSGLTIINFTLVLIIPFACLALTLFALQEMTTLSPDVYGKKLSFTDFFSSNSLDPWYNHAPSQIFGFIMNIYLIVLIIFALQEMLSFSFTCYDNNGKFPVVYTWPKRVFTIILYIISALVVFLLLAMVWFSLVWAVLASILNPAVYLAATTAALAFFAIMTEKYKSCMNLYKNTMENFEAIVKAKLASAFKESFHKVKPKIDKIVGSTKFSDMLEDVLPTSVEAADSLVKDVQTVITSFDPSQTAKDIIADDTTNFAQQISQKMGGISPDIVELLIAFAKKDNKLIAAAVDKIATALNCGGPFQENLVLLALSSFNPDNMQKQESYQQVEQIIKNLIRIMFPRITFSDKLTDICRLMYLKDQSPIINSLDSLIPDKTTVAPFKKLSKIFNLFNDGKTLQLKKELLSFVIDQVKDNVGPNQQMKDINNEAYEIFDFLRQLRKESAIWNVVRDILKNDVKVGLIGFKYTYPILCLSGLFYKNATCKNAIVFTLEEVFDKGNMYADPDKRDERMKAYYTQKEVHTQTQSNFEMLRYIVSGDKINSNRVAILVNEESPDEPKIDEHVIGLLSQVKYSYTHCFEELVGLLGYSSSKKKLREFYSLLLMKTEGSKISEICSLLNIQKEDYGEASIIIPQLIKILYLVLNRTSKSEFNQEISKCKLLIGDKQSDLQSQILERQVIQNEGNIQTVITYHSVKSEEDENDQTYFELQWADIMKLIHKNKAYIDTDRVRTFVKCIACVIARINNRIEQKDQHYLLCLEEISQFFEIPQFKMELLIDVLTGNPLNIFKVQTKEELITYDLRDYTCNVTFDTQRTEILLKILKGSKSSLSKAFLVWYRMRILSNCTLNNQSKFIQQFNISEDFLKIIQFNLSLKHQRLFTSKENQLQDDIQKYLKNQIKNDPKNKQSDQWECTSKFFDIKLNPCFDVGDKLKDIDYQISKNRIETLINFKNVDKDLISSIFSKEGKEWNDQIRELTQQLLSINPNRVQPHQVLRICSNLVQCAPIYSIDELRTDPVQWTIFAMIVNANHFSKLCNIYRYSDDLKKECINALISQEEVETSKKHTPNQEEFQRILSVLYERGYLQQFIDNTLKANLTDVTDVQCQQIMGILLGLSINDKKLARQQVVNFLLPTGASVDVIEGLIAVLQGDILAVQPIIKLCKELNIDHQLLYNLLAITGKNPDPNKSFLIFQDLLKKNNQSSKNSLCLSFLSLIQKDLSSLKTISSKLKVSHETAMWVLAGATGNMSILDEFITEIKERLVINSENSVQTLLKLSHGDSNCIYDLKEQRNDQFYIHEADLVESIFQITFFGQQILRNNTHHCKIRSWSERHIRIISNKLKNLSKSSEVSMKSLTPSIITLIKACWNDESSLQQICAAIKVNIKFKSGQTTDELSYMQSCLLGVINRHTDLLRRITEKQKNYITSLKEFILPYLQEKLSKPPKIRVEESKFNEKIQMFQSIKFSDEEEKLDENIKLAYRVGCTYSIARDKKFNQPFYNCITCNNASNTDSYVVCLACKVSCHAGHKFSESTFNQNKIKTTCCCGSGSFDSNNSINDQNPHSKFKQQQTCSMLRSDYYQKIVEDSQNDQEKDIIEKDLFKTNGYSSEDFINDVSTCFMVDSTKEQEDEFLINDKSLLRSVSLAENVILLAFGNVTSSFLALMSAKKLKKGQPKIQGNRLKIYKTMKCFVSIAQNDMRQFLSYGDGLAQAMGEVGTQGMPAVDQLKRVFLLTKGGYIPDRKDLKFFTTDKQYTYIKLFKDLFGTEWEPMITLHKILTLSPFDLSRLRSNTVQDEDFNNLLPWINKVLFSDGFGFNQETASYCHHIIGLMTKQEDSFNFFADKRKIPDQQAAVYLNLAGFNDQKDLPHIVSKLGKELPKELISQLCNLFGKGCSSDFIATFIVNTIQKLNPKVDMCSLKDSFQKYLTSLSQLMSGDDIHSIENLKRVVPKLEIVQGIKIDNTKAIEALISVNGLLKADLTQAASLVATLTDASDETTTRVIDIQSVLRGTYTNEQLDSTMKIIIPSYDYALHREDCSTIMRALNGSIMSLASIVDRHRRNDSYIHSMIASLHEGKTQYQYMNGQTVLDKDNASEEALEKYKTERQEKKKQRKNVIIRELYRFFETSIKSEDLVKPVENMIMKSFNDRVPLYMMMLLANKRSYIQDMFDMKEQLIRCIVQVHLEKNNNGEYVDENLVKDITTYKIKNNLQDVDPKTEWTMLKTIYDKEILYLQKIISFIDPFNTGITVKTLIKQFFRMTKGPEDLQPQLQMNLLEDLTSVQPLGNTFNTLDFLRMAHQVITSEEGNEEINYLYDHQMSQLLKPKSIFSDVLSLQKKMSSQEEYTLDELCSFLKLVTLQKVEPDLIGAEQKTTYEEDIEMIAKWLHFILLILSKSKFSNSENSLKQELQKRMYDAVDASQKYFKSYIIDTPLFVEPDKQNRMLIAVDTLGGLLSLAKGDLEGCKPLAMRLGGFPEDIDQLEQLIMVFRQNKNGLKFKQMSHFIVSTAGAHLGGRKETIDYVNRAIDDPKSMYDPKYLFLHFANTDGKIGIEEFTNVFKQLGINAPRDKIMTIFTLIDREKLGQLNYQQFVKSLKQIEMYVVQKLMEEFGITVNDMIISAGFIGSILLLLFAFIFVGIGAFSPDTSLASITNSLMPAAAAIGVYLKSKSLQDDPQEIQAKATAKLA